MVVGAVDKRDIGSSFVTLLNCSTSFSNACLCCQTPSPRARPLAGLSSHPTLICLYTLEERNGTVDKGSRLDCTVELHTLPHTRLKEKAQVHMSLPLSMNGAAYVAAWD